MKELLQAIVTRFNSSALYIADGVDIYFTAAPQDADAPYCVFNMVDDVPLDTFNTRSEDTRIQLTFYDDRKSVEKIYDYFEELKNLFDYYDLQVPGTHHTVCLRRLNSVCRRDPEDWWMLSTDYRIVIQYQFS